MVNVFLISVKKKKKHIAEKSFSVFGGAHGRPLNTLKLFFGKMFYYFFYTLIKNTFAIIPRFFAGII